MTVLAGSGELAGRRDRRRMRRLFRTAGRSLGTALLVFWILFPIYLLTISAFSKQSAIYQYPRELLPKLSLDTMRFFLNSQGVTSALLRSVVVAALSAAIAMLVGSAAGYALARHVFRGRDSYRVTIVSTRAFPVVVLSIPLAVFFLQLGIYDTIWAVAFMHAALALPFVVLITSGVFAGVPDDLEAAAQVFGCGRIRAFVKVVVPLVIPGLAAAAIFAVLTSYNEVFAASILTLQHPTLPALALNALDISPEPFKYAAAFCLMAPTFLFILLVRRYLFSLGSRAQL